MQEINVQAVGQLRYYAVAGRLLPYFYEDNDFLPTFFVGYGMVGNSVLLLKSLVILCQV
jgi:hypothetical protein